VSTTSSISSNKMASSANVAIRSGDVAVWYFGKHNTVYGEKTGRIYVLENNQEVSMSSSDVDGIIKNYISKDDELLIYGKDYQFYIPSSDKELGKYSIYAGIKCKIRIVDIPSLGNISLQGV